MSPRRLPEQRTVSVRAVNACDATYMSGLNERIAEVVTQEPTRRKDTCLRPKIGVRCLSILSGLCLEVEVADVRVLSVRPLEAVRQTRKDQAFQRSHLGSSIDGIDQLLLLSLCRPQVQRLAFSRLRGICWISVDAPEVADDEDRLNTGESSFERLRIIQISGNNLNTASGELPSFFAVFVARDTANVLLAVLEQGIDDRTTLVAGCAEDNDCLLVGHVV
jgi:hypothetical protein